jgi:uncharacterized protein YbjT (DUF2867 family)
MTTPVLLTGGTGTLGRHVAPLLREAGCSVRVLSRSAHEGAEGLEFVVGDLTTGQGIDAAVDGTSTVVHCAGTSAGDEIKTRNLVGPATRAGVRHLVYISVVGADLVPVLSRLDRAMFGYFASKRAAERIVIESGLPWTTLRATQFHDLVLAVVRQMAKLPVIPVPAGRFQPVDAGDVAARLVELALGTPAGFVPDIGGPRVYTMAELLGGYLSATGRRSRPMLPMRVPGQAAGAVRNGALLPADGVLGNRTWEDFLAERARQPSQ